MITNSVLFIWLFALAFPSPNTGFDIFDYDDDVERSNKYVDKLLKNILTENKYHPFLLEEINLVYNSSTKTYQPIIGRFQLIHGFVEGVKTMQRQEDSSIEDIGEDLLIQSSVVAGPLEFRYDGTFEFLDNSISNTFITLKAKIDEIEVDVEFTVDENTGLNAKLFKFNIDSMKGLDIEVSGLDNLEPILKGLKQWMMVEIELAAANLFQETIKNDFAKELFQTAFPVKNPAKK